LNEALKNIRYDRDLAKGLLQDVSTYLSVSADRHREVGLVASKYLETLQRSNEQIVKIASLIQDSDPEQFSNLNNDEKDQIYNDLEGKEDAK
jgi:hypothetical protein